MNSNVKIHVHDYDMEYSRDMWDAGRMVISDVNDALKELGIDVQFELKVHDEESEIPDERIEITNKGNQ